ncbi:unnamed protein product [Ranitomeya imitator]|uniref:E3 ubiquitin-protein ligase n=1 Tax=Ranitomeya imitator TaxID=111125 RepID=A0ABN9KUZ6_9NEOB|nr:unnamed protein product [Ranitomeya imitator]
MDSLFVIPDGTRRGLPASKATIALWIRTAILEAYRVKNRVPPTGVKAHSTRAVGASWAVHHRASALQLCKAVTWSSIHTFAKFYKVHTYASADASLGRRILQAAVDNDPKHTSRLCKGNLTKKESDGVLRQMTWPPFTRPEPNRDGLGSVGIKFFNYLKAGFQASLKVKSQYHIESNKRGWNDGLIMEYQDGELEYVTATQYTEDKDIDCHVYRHNLPCPLGNLNSGDVASTFVASQQGGFPPFVSDARKWTIPLHFPVKKMVDRGFSLFSSLHDDGRDLLVTVPHSVTWQTRRAEFLAVFLPVSWQPSRSSLRMILPKKDGYSLSGLGRGPSTGSLRTRSLIPSIRTVRLFLQQALCLLAGLQLDNASAVPQVSHLASTLSQAPWLRYLALSDGPSSIFGDLNSTFPGVEHWRPGFSSSEWELHSEIFHRTCLHWSTPEVVRMASKLNANVLQFMVWPRDPRPLQCMIYSSMVPISITPLPLRLKPFRKRCQPPGGSSIHPWSVSPNEWLGEKDFFTNTRDKDKAERKRKAEIARLRKEKIMAQMSEMQRHFIDENRELFQQSMDELNVSASTSHDSSSPALLDSKLIALGPHQTRFVEQSLLVTCILCQEEQAYNVDSKAMVLAAFIQRSTVFSKNRAKIIQDPDNYDPLFMHPDLACGTHTGSCGHIMHAHCWQRYFDAVQMKEQRRQQRLRMQTSYDVENGEFLCPLCQCLSNTINQILAEWVNVIGQQIRVLKELDGEKSTDIPEWFRPTYQPKNPYSDSIKEMLTTFGTATYKVGLNVHPNEEDPRVPIMCWESCAYTIQTIERILTDEERPLFGNLPCRQDDCLKSLTRFAAAHWTVGTLSVVQKHFSRLFQSIVHQEDSEEAPGILDIDMFHLMVSLVLSFQSVQCQDFSGYSLGIGDLYLFHLATMAHIIQIVLTSSPEDEMEQECPDGEEEQAALALYRTICRCTGSWCKHKDVRRCADAERTSISYPRESNKLIDLPEDYSSLINQASNFSCPKSGGDKSRAPTLCLVCGAMLCSQSYCCQTDLDGDDVGACTAHTYTCGSGMGIFLRVRECQVLFLAGKTKGCFYPPPYLDDYGETDQGLRRGNPLHLCKERFKKIQKLWQQHSVTEEIGHAHEANQTLAGIEWQHL